MKREPMTVYKVVLPDYNCTISWTDGERSFAKYLKDIKTKGIRHEIRIEIDPANEAAACRIRKRYEGR